MSFSKDAEDGHVEYLKAKRLPKLVDDMLEECCIVKPDNPTKHLIKYLSEVEGRLQTKHPKIESISTCMCVSETRVLEEESSDANQQALIRFMKCVCEYLNDNNTDELKTVIVGGDPTSVEEITTAICVLIAHGYRVVTTDTYEIPLPAIAASFAPRQSSYDPRAAVFISSSKKVLFNSKGQTIPLPTDGIKDLKKGLPAIVTHSILIAKYEGVLITDCEYIIENYIRMIDKSLGLKELHSLIESNVRIPSIQINCENGTAGRIARELIINRLRLPESFLISEIPLSEKHPAFAKESLTHSRGTPLGRDCGFIENASELIHVLRDHTSYLKEVPNSGGFDVVFDHLCPFKNSEGASKTQQTWNVSLAAIDNPITGVSDSLFVMMWLLKIKLSRDVTHSELLNEHYNKLGRVHYGYCEVTALGNELHILAGIGESASLPTALCQEFVIELPEQSASVKIQNNPSLGIMTVVWFTQLKENTSQNSETALQPAVAALLSMMKEGGWEGSFDNIKYPN